MQCPWRVSILVTRVHSSLTFDWNHQIHRLHVCTDERKRGTELIKDVMTIGWISSTVFLSRVRLSHVTAWTL